MAKKVKESAAAEEIVPAQEPVQPEVAVVPVEEPEPELQLEPQPQPEPESPPPAPVATGPTFGQRVNGFLGFLFRLISLLIILAVISIGLYYLLPRLYQQYIQPVQENTYQLQQLRDQQIENEQTIAELQTRLTEIETAQAQQAEAFATLEARVGEVETEIAAHTETLAALDQMQTTLQSQADVASGELGRQIKLLKGMELLSRARLFMYQSNFGLAEQDVQTARDLLTTIQPEAPEALAEELSAVILRLELTLSNLPDFPVAASDDLDIAWQILLGGTPPPQTVSVETPLPGLTPTPTPLSVTTTAIPTGAVTPTATP